MGEDIRRINESFDRHDINPDVQAAVHQEGSVIDPRGVGNEAHFVNHHCRPNCFLQKIRIDAKVFIAIVVLRNIKAGKKSLSSMTMESRRNSIFVV